MGYYLWIAAAATLTLSVVMRSHGHPSQQVQQYPMLQQQSPVMAAEPLQRQCLQLKTLKYNPNSNVEKIQNWSVVKVTKGPSSGQNSQSDEELQSRFCSVFSDINNCLGISYMVTSRGNQGFSAQTFAFDGKTQNLQPDERIFNLVDPHYEIYSVKSNAAPTVITGMNQGMAPEAETMFGAIAENANGQWKMFGLCDLSTIWVVVPADELQNNPQYLDHYKAEIEGALQQIKSSLASISPQVNSVMNTNMAPAPTSMSNPLPVVSVFGTPSSMNPSPVASPSQSSIQNAYDNGQLSTPPSQYLVQNAYGNGQLSTPPCSPSQYPVQNAYGNGQLSTPPCSPSQYPVQTGYGNGPATAPPPPPLSAVAYASIGSSPPPAPPSPLPPSPPAMMYGNPSQP